MIMYHNKKTEPAECVKGCVCMKRIGMLTSGGDCQALNAAMRGVDVYKRQGDTDRNKGYRII